MGLFCVGCFAYGYFVFVVGWVWCLLDCLIWVGGLLGLVSFRWVVGLIGSSRLTSFLLVRLVVCWIDYAVRLVLLFN